MRQRIFKIYFARVENFNFINSPKPQNFQTYSSFSQIVDQINFKNQTSTPNYTVANIFNSITIFSKFSMKFSKITRYKL